MSKQTIEERTAQLISNYYDNLEDGESLARSLAEAEAERDKYRRAVRKIRNTLKGTDRPGQYVEKPLPDVLRDFFTRHNKTMFIALEALGETGTDTPTEPDVHTNLN